MCTELLKEFEKSTEVLPFTKYGVSTLEEFEKTEKQIQQIEWLKKAGLSNEEVKLYQENEKGSLDETKVESSVLRSKLDSLYNKINDHRQKSASEQDEPDPTASITNIDSSQNKSVTFYPQGHPIHELKEIEESLFSHLKDNDIMPITKRRKILRRLERRKERILLQQKQSHINPLPSTSNTKLGSLWDVQHAVPQAQRVTSQEKKVLGPKERTLYTLKGNKIVRLEPNTQDEYQAVDIVVPQNKGEERLLEGTKMTLENIKKIDRFKDYEPGIPSKVLYIKNIAPLVTEERLALLFNQFQLENEGPIEVKLLHGRMRGQAFVQFRYENLAIQALDEVNGTIMSGRPLIAQFGRNCNRIQNDNR